MKLIVERYLTHIKLSSKGFVFINEEMIMMIGGFKVFKILSIAYKKLERIPSLNFVKSLISGSRF